MELDIEMSIPGKYGRQSVPLILYKGQRLSVKEISELDEIKNLGLTYGTLWARIHSKNRTYENVFKKVRFIKRLDIDEIDIDEIDIDDPDQVNGFEKVLDNLGRHPDKYEGEVFIGWLSEASFKRAMEVNYWTNHRLGNGRARSGFFVGLRPYFINKQEAIEKGWRIR